LPRLQGILLSKAADALKHWRQAEAQAGFGNPEFTEYSLDAAYQACKAGHIRFNEKKARSLSIEALKKGIFLFLDRAKEEAELGLPTHAIRGYLDSVQYFNQVLIGHFKENSAISTSDLEAVEKRAFTTRFERLKNEIETESRKNFYNTEHFMGEIDAVQAEGNRDFSLGLYLGFEWRNQIWRDAFTASIAKIFDFAESQADLGKIEETRHSLHSAHEQIARGNREHGFAFVYDLSRAEKILEKALFEGFEVAYQAAYALAKTGDLSKARHALEKVKNYLRDYNERFASLPGRTRHYFDKTRAELILLCARYPQCCFAASEK